MFYYLPILRLKLLSDFDFQNDFFHFIWTLEKRQQRIPNANGKHIVTASFAKNFGNKWAPTMFNYHLESMALVQTVWKWLITKQRNETMAKSAIQILMHPFYNCQHNIKISCEIILIKSAPLIIRAMEICNNKTNKNKTMLNIKKLHLIHVTLRKLPQTINQSNRKTFIETMRYMRSTHANCIKPYK